MASLKLINVLLRLKRQREDQSCGRFAIAKARVETIRGGIGRLEASLTEQDRSIRRALAATGSPRELSAAMESYRRQTREIRGHLADENASLSVARQTLADARLELLEAVARRRGLEQLAGRTTAGRVRAARRQDVKELDQLHQARLAMAQLSEAGGS